MTSLLISPAELHALIADNHVRILDCRFNLMDTGQGSELYGKSHIPGAQYAHLDEDLSGPIGSQTGRHPLPDLAMFCKTLSAWGIDSESLVVVYDHGPGPLAARAWWMCRWAGITNTRLLNGGFKAWNDAGFPVTDVVPQVCNSGYEVDKPSNQAVTTLQDIEGIAGGVSDVTLIDAREAARYRGDKEPIDPVAGHVPNALNLPFTGNLDANGQFKSADQLRQIYLPLVGAHPEKVAHMCGSGVTACHNLLAMELAGFAGSSLYVGSWSEWVRNPDHAIATEQQ